MNKAGFLCAIALVAGGVTFGAPAVAEASASLSPLGFKVFCIRNPNQCAGGGAASINLDDAGLSKLKRVNSEVNRSIRPRNDAKRDTWTLNPASGDCEDYVVTKRARLIKMGFPPSALRIASAKTRSGIGHAVLIVRTSEGNFVLDNLTNAIKPMAQANLRFLAMSGANPKTWSAI